MHSTAINTGSLTKRARVVHAGPFGDSGSSPTPQQLREKAEMLLECHPHFRGRTQFLQCEIVGRNLILNGRLPSYYLKQLAQEAMRGLRGIDRIENRIRVASPIGEIREPDSSSGNSMPDLARSKPR